VFVFESAGLHTLACTGWPGNAGLGMLAWENWLEKIDLRKLGLKYTEADGSILTCNSRGHGIALIFQAQLYGQTYQNIDQALASWH
jgi:hypothetical protein